MLAGLASEGSRAYISARTPRPTASFPVPIACVTDLDVMPDCAPEITGRVRPGEAWPGTRVTEAGEPKRTTRPQQITARRDEIRAKASGQKVETFIADEWTLEYDLAHAGLPREVFIAARLATADERMAAGKVRRIQ